jgi:hypothetical protein
MVIKSNEITHIFEKFEQDASSNFAKKNYGIRLVVPGDPVVNRDNQGIE